jgi:AcrR family transcriptional regulator
VTAPRRRDASRSRELLLEAAVALFAERGFDGTTVRDLGERAGVDPALISRYFGSKTGLYIATVLAEVGEAPPPDLRAPGRLLELLDRVRRRGGGPVFRAAVLPQEDPAVAAAIGEHLHTRLVGPLQDRFVAEGLDRPELRAALGVAAFIGVALARSAGTLDALAQASEDEVAELVAAMLEALAQR